MRQSRVPGKALVSWSLLPSYGVVGTPQGFRLSLGGASLPPVAGPLGLPGRETCPRLIRGKDLGRLRQSSESVRVSVNSRKNHSLGVSPSVSQPRHPFIHPEVSTKNSGDHRALQRGKLRWRSKSRRKTVVCLHPGSTGRCGLSSDGPAPSQDHQKIILL